MRGDYEMLQQGVVLSDRYEIVEKIGSGGMSIVYKAKCNKLERYVAVKVLRDEFCSDEDFVKKFKVEAQSAASLSHHNIVNIYDVGNDRKIYYIIMEYLEGITLKEYIKNKAPLSDVETIKIAASIASALEHAHHNHIIHRDIKPQNIMITKDGIAKVADFGIARVATDKTIVAPTNASGSVHYISPEQARGGFTDEKSDLYSLGITMYEMATGKLPYQAESPVSVALLHIHEDLPKPSEKNSNISPCLESIIIKATMKKAQFRYDSAKELISDLKKANLSPEEDFVNLRVLDDDSPTLFMSDNDMKKIWNDDDNQQEYEEKDKSILERIVIFSGIISAIILVSIVTFFVYNAIKDRLNFNQEIIIPNVEGMLLSEAKVILDERGLDVNVTEIRYDDDFKMNYIIDQTPDKDEMVKDDKIVSLIVSKGKEMFEVPQVVNLQFNNAEKLIANAHLTHKMQVEYHDTIPRGVVIRTYPEEGKSLEKGSTVTIIVSNGKEEKKIGVPNLKELTVQQAVNKLSELNLVLGSRTYINHDTVPKGKIISQTVNIGEQVKEGYIIDVTVSEGKKIVLVETININDILDVAQNEGLVKVALVNEGKESTVFDKLLKHEDFPLSINVTGKGKATVKIYLNNVFQYEKSFVFNKEAN
jgi:serine/threonine-protein kinase